MVIYLRHPVHGTKVACAELEAVYDEKNGWVRFDVDEEPVTVNEMKRPRGRPRVEVAELGA
tara:strand:- start:592 stop:774 length:183 start_codon:yes stop_codon:yes gene_type:complete